MSCREIRIDCVGESCDSFDSGIKIGNISRPDFRVDSQGSEERREHMLPDELAGQVNTASNLGLQLVELERNHW